MCVLQNPYTVNPGGFPRICAVDCGMKNNQIRCLVKRGARVDVVPWNHSLNEAEYDGLFLSNGPGDPEKAAETIQNLTRVLNAERAKPIFGICLGHQLLAKVCRSIDRHTYVVVYVVFVSPCLAGHWVSHP